jgi:methenyltetrahydrofolate cyclohydrolase
VTTLGRHREISVRDFLTAVASADGVHDAVSASAVAGAIGASLLLRVAALPKTRSNSVDDQARLIEVSTALSAMQEQLIEAIETETAVKIFAARNMPQTSETQRTERQAAIQLALRAAADVPLEIMRLCDSGLKHAETVARHSSRVASADVQLAVALLHAAFSSARASVEAKLSSLTDTRYITSVIDEIARLSDEASTAARNAESHLHVPPA